MKNKTILITGATGLIGSELTKNFHQRGWSVLALTTRKKLPPNLVPFVSETIQWDNQYRIKSVELLKKVNAVIHLAGASVTGKRWDAAYKNQILESRTGSTEELFKAFERTGHKPEAFICASATGYYGSRNEEILTEESGKGSGFLSDVCEAWEHTAHKFSQAGTRQVSLRTGIILSKKGGALPKMLIPFYFFVGGSLGTGRQWFSWISLDDAVAIYERAVEDESMSGIYNVVAPVPVRMYEVAKSIGSLLHRPYIFPVPEFILKLALGESASEITKSQRVLPKRLLEMQFEFIHPGVLPALRDILANGR
jgi:uncharacterized protein (TIGR01777 family)